MRVGAVVGLLAAWLVHSTVAVAGGRRARVVYASGDTDELPMPREEHPLRRDEEVPPGHHVEERTRKAPIYAGLAVAGGGYLFSALGAAGVEEGGLALIPFFGPWIWLAGDYPTNGSGGHEPDAISFAPIFILIGGLAQTTGAILMIAGAGSSRTWVVPGEQSDARRIFVTPGVDRHGASVSIRGAF